MKTLVLQTQEAVTGIGFDKLGYYKIPIHKNLANTTDILSLNVSPITGETGKALMEGGKIINPTTGAESNELSLVAGTVFNIGKLTTDIAYLYLSKNISSFYFPTLNAGASSNSLMAYFDLSKMPNSITAMRANSTTAIYSFTLTGSFENLKRLTNLNSFDLTSANIRNNTSPAVLSKELGLLNLSVLFINTSIVVSDFDSVSIKDSPLTSLSIRNFSKSRINTAHLSNRALSYLMVSNNPYKVSDHLVSGSLSDLNNVSLELRLDGAQFSSGYRAGTTWKSSIIRIYLTNTNLSALDGDKLLSDLDQMTSAPTRILSIPARTTASDSIVTSLQSKGWTITVASVQ